MKLAERIYLAQVNASIENRKSKIENRLTSVIHAGRYYHVRGQGNLRG